MKWTSEATLSQINKDSWFNVSSSNVSIARRSSYTESLKFLRTDSTEDELEAHIDAKVNYIEHEPTNTEDLTKDKPETNINAEEVIQSGSLPLLILSILKVFRGLVSMLCREKKFAKKHRNQNFADVHIEKHGKSLSQSVAALLQTIEPKHLDSYPEKVYTKLTQSV